MTLVGVAGLLLALSAFYIADLRSDRSRLVVFVLLFVMHSIASSGYYLLAQSTGSDAVVYYEDTLHIYGRITGLGTIFTTNFVQILKENLGGTFFDYFMIFQAMGFWGLIFLVKIFNEIFQELDVRQPNLTYLPLFLPGLHYWTGAIGKDAPLFLAICVAIWSSMRLSKRLVSMGAATLIMLVFRPHIALISLMALGIASLVDSQLKLWMKGALLVGVGLAGAMVVTSLDSTYSINVSSADSVSDFMSSQALIGEDSGADMAIMNGNIVFKVFTFWLRPFFFDAENMMGYIASTENIVILILFMLVAGNLRLTRTAIRKVLFLRYSGLFFIITTAILASMNYNVGLGLRQKMMAMPALLVFFAALIAIKAAGRSVSRLPEAQGLPLRPIAGGGMLRTDIR